MVFHGFSCFFIGFSWFVHVVFVVFHVFFMFFHGVPGFFMIFKSCLWWFLNVVLFFCSAVCRVFVMLLMVVLGTCSTNKFAFFGMGKPPYRVCLFQRLSSGAYCSRGF